MSRNPDDRRTRPQVAIPTDPLHQQQRIQYPYSVSQVPVVPYTFEVTPPSYNIESRPLVNPWDNSPPTPDTARPRVHSMVELSGRPPNRTASAAAGRTVHMAFPEPQIYRSVSSKPTLQSAHALSHRHSRSELISPNLGLHSGPSTTSFTSMASSYNQDNDSDHYVSGSGDHNHDLDSEELAGELSNFSLDSEEGLRRFQDGRLPENDQAWHRLVPPEARDALGKQEVQRQSVLFEVFKAESEYVSDLVAIEEVFIAGLRNSSPPIISQSRLPKFVDEVFGNLSQIVAHHQRMLGALFSRQREQHPLVLSISDIILDTVLKSDFRSSYEVYIKNYPLAESYHRKELKRNPAYQTFLQSVSTHPRIRKRDLITFLSRPVTRLPRLNLLLEQILKATEKDHDHPDIETLPIILGILGDCVKSTQPGIEAAESKVKFWALCESLVFQTGEIIDMDLYDESRSLVYSGPLSRRSRIDSAWSESWSDLTGALLDNYFLLTREEKRTNGITKRHIMSRPLPLEYIRLGSFTSAPETRKERVDDGGLLDSLRSQYVSIYPFTIYHASNKSTRRYTFYVGSESTRKRWYSSFVDAIGVHRVRQEANMWFYSNTLTDHFFRAHGNKMETGAKPSGRVTSSVPFASGGRKFLAVGCSTGVYVAHKGLEEYRRIFTHPSPTSIAAVQNVGEKMFNRFIIHSDADLVSYSLDILAKVTLGETQPNTLQATMEKMAGQDGSVVFFKHVHIGDRVLIIYASKRRLQVSMALQVLEAVHTVAAPLSTRRNGVPSPLSFRSFGEPGYIPKDAYDITPLSKTVGVCTRDGVVIIDPTNLSNSAVTIVPNLEDATSSLAMSTLKSRLEDAKPLGLARVTPSELLVVYDALGCYITKHGVPSRSSQYIKWETKAISFAQRGQHIMLFSPQFIEIRNIATGRIVQVIEGSDLRLLYSGPVYTEDDNVVVAMRGSKDDKDGISEKIIELVATSEIVATPATPALPGPVPSMWDEWDM
ncbi:hypothetical protein BDZ94DRAFT_1209777 [Collybia nuda]|uniref:Rho1 guanine nucleotide exchange factor 1 n=1 Tax=Collybia nuda TaxID=64659 RepID=A0A9P5YGC9_9AGAR|nr:hypothetical protein BDZ94DRAFT_1209777 [Collybia nuda]